MRAKKILLWVLFSFLAIMLIAFAVVLIYINNTIAPVKDLNVKLTNNEYNYSKIYDVNGDELKFSENLDSNFVSIQDMPDYTKEAFISIEDKSFYKHNGLNYKRIAKATFNNLKSKNLGEGASTITQQLVKNRFLTNEKTFSRKIKEAYLSKKLEKTESKDKILETYLNTIYFGNGAYGIGNASKTFFNKDISELTLSESCILAGCIKSPSNYSPLNNLSKSIERRNLVLSEMLKDNKITIEEYNQAIEEDVDISNSNITNTLDSLDLYSKFVLDEASKILNTNVSNVLHGGYKIYTYQDNNTQKILDQNISNQKYYHTNEHGNIADSLSIIVDNKSHSVSAIAGKSKYNLLNVKRQPGSLIKPILTYAPAINEGLICSKTQILDEKIDIGGYSPNNVGNVYHGYVSVEDSVAQSLNIPTVKISQELGLDKCMQYAKKCGINFNEDKDTNYAITLGGFTDGVTLKDITDAYSIFTNNGNYVKNSFIKKINNSANMTLYNRKLSETYAVSPQTSYLMTDILKYSVENGTSKKLSKLQFDVAGKTGTVAVKGTNYNTDVYSLAYTQDHTMSVWLGNYTMQNDYHLSGKNNGGTYATQLILDTFDTMYQNNIPSSFVRPDGVETITIDAKTLEQEHIVVLGDNVPERYQVTCLVDSKFKPQQMSTIFEKLDPITIDITKFKNSCKISFDANDFVTYEIYRKSNGNYQKVKTIKDTNGVAEFTDTNITNNTNYTYYVKAKSNYSSAETNSNKIAVNIPKEYKKLIENDLESNSLGWLFS